MDLYKTLRISADGMRAQGTRLRIISENLANAESTAKQPGGEPFRRKVVSFASLLDRASGVESVRVRAVGTDPSEFERRYEPNHPAADAEGYVLLPNVNALIELADLREAQRSYEANLRVLQASRAMLEQTIGLLK